MMYKSKENLFDKDDLRIHQINLLLKKDLKKDYSLFLRQGDKSETHIFTEGGLINNGITSLHTRNNIIGKIVPIIYMDIIYLMVEPPSLQTTTININHFQWTGGMTEITYHLQPKRKQITVLVLDLEILTRLDKNLLNRGMMRKVDSGKQMMHRVKVQPKINYAVQERRVHRPICTDM